jgi:hypothetical protein
MPLPNPGLTTANAIELASATVEQLPLASKFAGSLVFVTDASGITAVGQAAAGGGTQQILAWSNGTTWNTLAF